ncbi:MAG TPA: orotate phosphoribosyltransferase [Alphaproteobacteria bacterium]|jgi:orotate phosphoribosyltransferase
MSKPIAEPRLARLRDIIKEHSLLSGRNFKLASGKESGFYFDMKKSTLHPEGANLMADLLLDELEKEDVTHVGGVAMGAVPMVAALCVRSHQRGKKLEFFYVRKEGPKDHGAETLIDGYFGPGAKVAILEDVTTTGGSAFKTIGVVEAQGAKVQVVLTVVDRLEGAQAAFAERKLKLVTLLTNEDFK